MGLIKEFKDFAVKGNVIDLAIGVVIGAAFTKIIGSFIDDVLTPLLLKPAMEAAHISDIKELKAGTVKYGLFLSNVLNFLIVAFVLFLVIKGINRMKKKEEAALVPPTTTEILLTEIRDALKK
ncbi:MAG: large conductance mechanosensitive channel protein MscL [Bacteroidetes bacterium]|nr:large conductance mechanosensitive channel protein MscL [Bacteroidota bacterium]